MDNPRIVFMGTPHFAVPALQKLIERRADLIGVVTQPDRPVGRGQHLKPSPIKELSRAHNLPIFQPTKVKDPDFIDVFLKLHPDLVVVVAYGQIIPRQLLDIPTCGFINVHSSLLPAYRGAAPINRALINGETQTGVTIMRLDEGMDTGDIIIQEAVSILPEDDAATLHDRLARHGAQLLSKTLDMLKTGGWHPVPQDHHKATYAPMLKKEDGLINWTEDAARIANKIRGMTPWPGCFTYCGDKLLKIHRAEVLEKQVQCSPGTIIESSRQGIEVATGRGVLVLKNVQLEGKKKMSAEAFLKGHQLAPGTGFPSRKQPA